MAKIVGVPKASGGASKRPRKAAPPSSAEAPASESRPSRRGTRKAPEPRASSPPRARAPSREGSHATPEDYLLRAMRSVSAPERARWAKRGLAVRSRIDRTTQSMLLRQLYLGHFEARSFTEAEAVSQQALALGVLPDLVHQDVARAKQALGDVEGASSHLRLAARHSPPDRRAFHWWTLGSILFLARKYPEAISALARATRWSTKEKPLYQAHLAVVMCASGQRPRNLRSLGRRLEAVPAGQGYGRFVLGQIAFYDRRPTDARRFLRAFVRRTETGRPAVAVALAQELAEARALLDRLDALVRS